MKEDISEPRTGPESPVVFYERDRPVGLETEAADTLLSYEPFRKRIEMVNSGIEDILSSKAGHSEILYEAAAYLLRAGGKRLRPLLTILSCEATGGTAESALPYAIATEFIQTASLIHDDIIDGSDRRRGVPSVHKKYGLRVAILAADLLIALSIKIVSERGKPEVIVHLGKCGIQMVEGEATDMLIDLGRIDIDSQNQYFKMIESKTVSFIREVARLGGIVSDASEDHIEQLGKYGELIGYAFQIRDDIIDFIDSSTGKVTHIDLLKKRYNYPIILALETLSIEERKAIIDEITEGNLESAVNLIDKTDALSKANEVASDYIEQAKKLVEFSDFKQKQLLMKLADFIITRKH